MTSGATRGFTLFELLVVVAITALIASVAVLSLDSLDDRRAEQEAERVAALIRLASDEAVLSGRDLGLRVGTDTLEFLTWQLAADGRSLEWVVLDQDPQLRPRRRQEGLTIDFERDAAPSGRPQLLLPASGDTEPFRLAVRSGPATWWVSGDADGEVRVAREASP